MQLSWSQKLFLKINNQIGKRRRLDELMKFSAHWLIYFYFFAALWWGLNFLAPAEFKLFVKLLLTASAVALSAGWLGAVVFRHPRPVEELPEIKEILMPFQTFKSFPSDHAMMSFILFFIAVFFGAGWFFGGLFFTAAILIALSRVYVGVHYPRDIMGGMVYALVFSLLSFWLLGNITQPAYVWLVKFMSLL